jgi:hypothetical protein
LYLTIFYVHSILAITYMSAVTLHSLFFTLRSEHIQYFTQVNDAVSCLCCTSYSRKTLYFCCGQHMKLDASEVLSICANKPLGDVT